MANQLDELNPQIREEGVDTNVITIITKNGETELPMMSKDEAAHRILDEIVK